MPSRLQALARICTNASPTAADVTDACSVITDALAAEDAYVIRAGDPAFVRLGCPCDPGAYEIKQKGYWLVWRQLVTNAHVSGGLFDAAERIVAGGKALVPSTPATHLAAILPGDESNSDLLIVRGPWPDGLDDERIAFFEAARPILAHLVGNVLDAQRRARQREQLESLANVSNAFNQAQETEHVLSALATALAKASGFDWVVIETYDETGEVMLERTLNVARYSATNTAASWRNDKVVPTGTGQLQFGAALARAGKPFLMPDVHDEQAWERRQAANPVDPVPLRKFYERAHIVSTAVFPVVFQQKALGGISFASSTPHAFEAAEVEFLTALVAQAATAIKGLRLYQELQDSREEIRQREEWFRSLVQHASNLITVIEPDTTIRYQSPAISRVLGLAPEMVVGQRLLDSIHRDDAAAFLAALGDLMTKHDVTVTGEGRVRHRNGDWRHLEFTGTDQRENPAINGLVLNVRDVTERKLLEQQLRYQALHDPLTKLANRTRFTDRLEHALLRSTRSGDRVAVLFMDLDNFKGVNDSLGHTAGDRLLTEVAVRVQDCLRPVDTVARLGGDEFAVLIEDLSDVSEAADVTERIFEALQAPFDLEGKELLVRASIGVAVGDAQERGTTAEALLRDADTAMYVAKSRGKGRYEVFEAGMQVSMTERLDLIADLHHAVENREFILHYQPVILLRTGELFGVEALVRWQHPRRGLIPPGDFISLAEDSGAIVGLGRWVLEEACRQAADWQAAYPGIADWTLSVNVSAKQLQRPGFAAEVERVLGETGLHPHRLILEITESVMMQDIGLMMSRLQELKALGVRLAIDDFGTGYSSLSYLRQFPFDLLKIDKSFIDDVDAEPQRKDLTRAIIELGKTLDVELVAEGIERSEQLARLTTLDCELGQGFYFAKPMEPRDVEDLFARIEAGADAASDAA